MPAVPTRVLAKVILEAVDILATSTKLCLRRSIGSSSASGTASGSQLLLMLEKKVVSTRLR